MKINRLLMAATFMSLFLFGPSLFAQQEVDPTWYNPWPEANKATVPASQVATPKNRTKAVSRASDPKTVSRASDSKTVSRASDPKTVSRASDSKTVSRASQPKSVARASDSKTVSRADQQPKMPSEKQSLSQQANLRAEADGRDNF
jgi:hypothetical protein